MQTKKTIAIIGATTAMGAKMATALSSLHHRLLLFGMNEADLVQLQSLILQQFPSTELELMHCAMEASWEADIILLTIPAEMFGLIAEKIKVVAAQKIVIIFSDQYNNAIIDEVKLLLPDSKLVAIENESNGICISGPHQNAVKQTTALFKEAGLPLTINIQEQPSTI